MANITTIKHRLRHRVAKAGVFSGISSYDDLIAAIISYGETAGKLAGAPDSKEYDQAYNMHVGEAFEVYAEFFLAKYGNRSNTTFGVDILEDNINECRKRVIDEFTNNDSKLIDIVNKNIICKDFLAP